ncbi:isochorismate synthase [Bacillus timonensis]|nr:isochorismate synthase [Bacillus timonensis]
MATTQYSGLTHEYMQKDSSQSPKIISIVKQIKDVDPLIFFAAGKKRYQGERFFWQSPSKKHIFVGLGSSYKIEAINSPNRFQHMEEEWKELMGQHELIGHSNVFGTGPILFGGFSFDPLKHKTNLWKNFKDGMFSLPTILLSVIEGKVWLTKNIVVTEEIEEKITEFEKIEREILDNNELFPKEQQGKHITELDIEPEKWKSTVGQVAYDIQQNEIEKVVLAREIRIKSNQLIDPEQVLANLREEQPHSYLFAFESVEDCFIGASPERLVKKEGKQIKSTCLAGSIARGTTLIEDEELEKHLLNDRKNLVEHHLVVEMIKEAMEEVCHSVSTPASPGIYKMRDIQHLYTPVKGEVKQETSLLSIVERLHPTPALGGFPKQKAIEKIRSVELLDRGWYASPIGWIDLHNNGEFAVAIRSGLLQGYEASLFAGCGIVGDSTPESEYKETQIKFKPMLSAIGGTNE